MKPLDPYEQFILSREEAGEDPREIRRKLRESATHRCACGRPATKLCDREIARCLETGEALICSRPMCSECATCDGLIFACGTGGGIETRDLCPSHTLRRKVEVLSALELRRWEKLGKGLVFQVGRTADSRKPKEDAPATKGLPVSGCPTKEPQ